MGDRSKRGLGEGFIRYLALNLAFASPLAFWWAGQALAGASQHPVLSVLVAP